MPLTTSSSDSPAVRKNSATITIVSCLTPDSQGLASSSSSLPTRAMAAPDPLSPTQSGRRRRTKPHYVLTVELDDTSPLCAVTRLTVHDLRRTIERVLLPPSREASSPYRLMWRTVVDASVSSHAPTTPQPHTAGAVTTPMCIAEGNGTVRMSASGDMHASTRDDVSWPETTYKVPAGAVVEVYPAHSPDAPVAIPASSSHVSSVTSSAMSSPKRSAKNVSFVFDEAVVRAQEPARVMLARHTLSPPRRTNSTTAVAVAVPPSTTASGRLPLRRASVEGLSALARAGPLSGDRNARVKGNVSASRSPSSSGSSSPPSRLSVPREEKEVALGRTTTTTTTTTEPFHRTITPSPLRADDTATVTTQPGDTAAATGNNDISSSSTSTSQSVPTSVPLPRSSSSSAPSSPSSLTSSSLSSPHVCVRDTQADAHPRIIAHAAGDRTLPYTEASTLTLASTVTESVTTESEKATTATRDAMHAASATTPTRSPVASVASVASGSSRSMSSPAFGSFYSSLATERSPSVLAGSQAAAQPLRTEHPITSAPRRPPRAPFLDADLAVEVGATAARHRLVVPSPTPEKGSTSRTPGPPTRASWLLSPLPINVEDDDEEEEEVDERTVMEARTPTAYQPFLSHHHAPTGPPHSAHNSESRQLRYSESPQQPRTAASTESISSPATATSAAAAAAPAVAATSLSSVPSLAEDTSGVRTSRDVLRAAERMLDKYRITLAPDSRVGTDTTTVVPPSSPPPSPPPASEALVAQLHALAALLHTHNTRTAEDEAAEKQFEAEKAYDEARHAAQIKELASYVDAQKAAWEKKLAQATRRTAALAHASDRLAAQEAATASQLVTLRGLLDAAHHTLTDHRDLLAALPDTIAREKIAHKGHRTSTAPAPSAHPAEQLSALASLLVSETAFMQDDVAYLAALRYRGTQQAAALRAAEASSSHAGGHASTRTVALSRATPPSVRAVPVCRAPLCLPPPLPRPAGASSPLGWSDASPFPSLAAWLASKPLSFRTAFAAVVAFYQSQASRHQQLTMNKGYGVVVKPHDEVSGAHCEQIRLYDPRHRPGSPRARRKSSGWEAMSFPHAYALPDGTLPSEAAGTPLARALSALFDAHVQPLLQSLMDHGAAVLGAREEKETMGSDKLSPRQRSVPPSSPESATVLFYGAAGAGKTTCLFGLPPLPHAADKDEVFPPADNDHDNEDNQSRDGQSSDVAFRLSLSDDGSHNESRRHAPSATALSPQSSSALLSVADGSDQASSTDIVFDSHSTAASSPLGVPHSADMQSPRSTVMSLQFQEESTLPLSGPASLRESGAAPLPDAAVANTLTATKATPAKAGRAGSAMRSVGEPTEARARSLPQEPMTCHWGPAEGVLPRTLAWLLSQMRSPHAAPAHGLVQRIELSAVDVYYAQLYDLLDDPRPPSAEVDHEGAEEVAVPARPAWDVGSPSLRPGLHTHPSHLTPLVLVRTPQTRRATTTKSGNHDTNDYKDEDSDEEGEAWPLADATGTAPIHRTVWTTKARRVAVNSLADARAWLQIISDRRCQRPPPPAKAATPAAARTTHEKLLEADAAPTPPPGFYQSHVVVRVHVRMVAAQPSSAMQTETEGNSKAVGTTRRDVTALAAMAAAAAGDATGAALPASPLRLALNLPCQGVTSTLPVATPSAQRRPSSSPAVPLARCRSQRPPPPRTHDFTLAFVDLAGSVRQDAFTQLPSTRAVRDGAQCVRRQLAAVRDVLEAIARADATQPETADTTRTTTSASLGVRAGKGRGGAAPITGPAAWEPVSAWPLAVPKLGDGVRLTTCALPRVVQDCPLPLPSRTVPVTRTRMRTPPPGGTAASRAATDLVELSSMASGSRGSSGRAAHAEEHFRRALRPWLPRAEGEDTDDRDDDEQAAWMDEDMLAPPVPVPAHVRIPYYRSPLTRLLQPTLGPGPACRTLVLCCVKPCSVVEYLPAAVEALQAQRKKARAQHTPPLAVNEETLLATAQAALEHSAPLLMAETHAVLAFAQCLNGLALN